MEEKRESVERKTKKKTKKNISNLFDPRQRQLVVLKVLRVGPHALHLDHLRLPELPHRLVGGVLVDDAAARGHWGGGGRARGVARELVVPPGGSVLSCRCCCCRGLRGAVGVRSRREHGERVLCFDRGRKEEKKGG